MKRNKKKTRYGNPAAKQAKQTSRANPSFPAKKAALPAKVSTTPNVTPQQQAAYAAFVNDCYRILFNQQAFQATLKLIDANDNPVQGLAQAVVMAVLQVQENYQKKGQPLTPAPILLRGSLELLSTVAEVSKEAKLHTFTLKELAEACAQAVVMYKQQAQKAGLFNPAQAQQESAAFPPNPVFARVLAPNAVPKMVSSAPKKSNGLQNQSAPVPQAPLGGSPPNAPPSPTSGLLSQQGA